jgi:hypothetical protein
MDDAEPDREAGYRYLVRAVVKSALLGTAVAVGAWLTGICSWIVPVVALPLYYLSGALIIRSARRNRDAAP